MAGRWESIQVGDSPMGVFVETPDGAGPHPCVVVIMGAGGVDTFAQSAVGRLAGHGYATAAPDLYHRQGPPPQEVADLPQGHPDRSAYSLSKAAKLLDVEIEADVDAGLAVLRRLPSVGSAPAGITGFCMGGQVAYLIAARNSEFRAAGAFYGRNTMVHRGETPTPFEHNAGIGCPVIGFFGEDDDGPSPDEVRVISVELTKYGKEHTFHSYAGAGHNFANFTIPAAYREETAEDAWAKLLTFFEQHLKVGALAGGG